MDAKYGGGNKFNSKNMNERTVGRANVSVMLIENLNEKYGKTRI